MFFIPMIHGLVLYLEGLGTFKVTRVMTVPSVDIVGRSDEGHHRRELGHLAAAAGDVVDEPVPFVTKAATTIEFA
jgi:hypothetical protein